MRAQTWSACVILLVGVVVAAAAAPLFRRTAGIARRLPPTPAASRPSPAPAPAPPGGDSAAKLRAARESLGEVAGRLEALEAAIEKSLAVPASPAPPAVQVEPLRQVWVAAPVVPRPPGGSFPMPPGAPFFGARLADLTDEEAREIAEARRRAGGAPAPEGETGRGARLDLVIAESPAEKAGLKAGDVLLRFGETPVNAGDDVRRAVAAGHPGQPVAVLFWRTLRRGEAVLDGSERRTVVTLGEPVRKAPRPQPEPVPMPPRLLPGGGPQEPGGGPIFPPRP